MGNKSFLDAPWMKWVLAIATVGSLAWGIYQTFHVRNPKLQYDIQSQIELFNKTEELVSVRVLVDTLDVLASNMNIMYYVVRVKNVGNEHLRVNDYDEGSFGLQVLGGIVIQDELIGQASNPHILERFKAIAPVATESFVEIPRIPLDVDDWYSIAFAVLHNDDTAPSLTPVGKIIGQKKLLVAAHNFESPDEEKKGDRRSIFDNVLILIMTVLAVFIGAFARYFNSSYLRYRKIKKEFELKERIISTKGLPITVVKDFRIGQISIIKTAYRCYGLGEEKISSIYKGGFIMPDYTDEVKTHNELFTEICELISRRYLSVIDDKVVIPPKFKEAVSFILKEMNDFA